MPELLHPPRSVCILRLSALGDCCHVVPSVRTLQQAWPNTTITWVIGQAESALLGLLPGVEFITVSKARPWHAAGALRAALGARRFDVLLNLQLSLRASLYSTLIRAPLRVGFDRARARELQWLFCNAKVQARHNEHVLDSFFGFTDFLGITERCLKWQWPLPAAALDWAAAQLPAGTPALLVSPCSSHRLRNWSVAGYAAVIAHAVRRHNLAVLLCGPPGAYERDFGAQIRQTCRVPLLDLIGQDTLPKLLALMARATAVLSPDAGPAHMATMVGTPVIGLYAATRLERSGPYLSRQWCVSRFEQAALRFRGRPAEQLPWAEKIEVPGVMELIEPAAVMARLDELLARPLLP